MVLNVLKVNLREFLIAAACHCSLKNLKMAQSLIDQEVFEWKKYIKKKKSCFRMPSFSRTQKTKFARNLWNLWGMLVNKTSLQIMKWTLLHRLQLNQKFALNLCEVEASGKLWMIRVAELPSYKKLVNNNWGVKRKIIAKVSRCWNF